MKIDATIIKLETKNIIQVAEKLFVMSTKIKNKNRNEQEHANIAYLNADNSRKAIEYITLLTQQIYSLGLNATRLVDETGEYEQGLFMLAKDVLILADESNNLAQSAAEMLNKCNESFELLFKDIEQALEINQEQLLLTQEIKEYLDNQSEEHKSLMAVHE